MHGAETKNATTIRTSHIRISAKPVTYFYHDNVVNINILGANIFMHPVK